MGRSELVGTWELASFLEAGEPHPERAGGVLSFTSDGYVFAFFHYEIDPQNPPPKVSVCFAGKYDATEKTYTLRATLSNLEQLVGFEAKFAYEIRKDEIHAAYQDIRVIWRRANIDKIQR